MPENQQRPQQKLFCVIFDEMSMEYLKKMLKEMSVKGEDTPVHATALTRLLQNDPWPNVIQSLNEQFKKQQEAPPAV